jgi:NodT family efflux transporter outer membrane factor (OMF) lipoprotein
MKMDGGYRNIAWPRAAAALLLAALAGACVIGPKYTKPSAPVPPAYKEQSASTAGGEWKPAQPSDRVARGNWWESFHDGELNELEAKLNISNQNIAAAAANVLAARAMIREARSQYFPTVSANPSVTNSHIANGFGRPLGFTFTTYALPIEASWEPDLWGRVRNTVMSSAFAAQASFADLENVRLAAQAELATDYVELRGQDALKQVLDAAVDRYQEAVDITRARFVAGLEADEAVAQAETQLNSTRAQDTNVGVLRAQLEHAIARLIGQPPSTFSIAVAPKTLTPPTTPAGVPSELLERRPDIAAAERSVAQANAQIGIAQTAYFPTALLSGSAGFDSLTIGQWLTWPSRVWSVGPSLAQTLFDGGLRKATVQQFRAQYDSTVANYRQTVLTAFQEVEDNLAAVRILTQVIEEQNSAVESAQRATDEATTRYVSGIDPYLNVIAAQTMLLNNQQAVVASRTQHVVASVQLIKALGGGWDSSSIPSPKALAASQ